MDEPDERKREEWIDEAKGKRPSLHGTEGKGRKKKRKADLKTEGKIGALQFRAKHSHDGPIARRHTDALVRG